jgi:hypothetical protein
MAKLGAKVNSRLNFRKKSHSFDPGAGPFLREPHSDPFFFSFVKVYCCPTPKITRTPVEFRWQAPLFFPNGCAKFSHVTDPKTTMHTKVEETDFCL